MISNEEAMERFKQFVIKQHELTIIAKSIPQSSPDWDAATDLCVDYEESQDWFSLSLGFFCAIGCTVTQAHVLSVEARYTHQYWC